MANYVEVPPIDYSDSTFLTSKTYHGSEILVNNIVVGRCTKFARPSLSRDIAPIRELAAPGQTNGSFGRIIEQVPGKAGDESNKISIARTEIWGKELELAFGYAATFIDLCDQNRPFSLRENLYKGTQLYQQYLYGGCWFASLGTDEFTTDGDAIVKVNADIQFCSRTKITGP